MNFRRFCV